MTRSVSMNKKLNDSLVQYILFHGTVAVSVCRSTACVYAAVDMEQRRLMISSIQPRRYEVH